MKLDKISYILREIIVEKYVVLIHHQKPYSCLEVRNQRPRIESNMIWGGGSQRNDS